MKRLLLFLILLIANSQLHSQLDREHWFAPMIDRVQNPNQFQSIYLSTPETNPFTVEVYNNNTVIGTVTISKGNPAKYKINNRQIIITTSQYDLFKPVPMGIYLKGEKPFFASLRFSTLNHGEIQTSKGSAGKGTEFRAVMAPITADNEILNFMNSIMATEDNTDVTITGFKPNVNFSDGKSRTQITFTLNKGQSYIIDGTGGYTNNYTGYIGAKISSTKPVVIANGNFNGQYASNTLNSSDILMDQGVPTDKLGQDFVLMKGNGNIGSEMEKALVVAHEDGTQVYLNNNATPVVTLNAGQHYLTPDNAYINQGYDHYNLFVHTSKNAYVYQLLAGDGYSSEVATGGMNYIPPLSCYLPRKIDEIGRIDENEYSSNAVGYSLTVPTKLNIITEKGATITVQRNGTNMVLNASNGPFNVSGNGAWVTYSIPNVTGNIAVISTAAVTAGISAGNDAVGYGGYFAGFSYIPAVIKREGDCLPGVKLEITEGFSHYLWLIKNASGGYDPAPGLNNTNVYIPSQAGIYAVQIQQGSCPMIQTADFKFYNCTTYTNNNYDICTTTTIQPIFALSSQTLNTTSVKIETPPTKGTAVINADGSITYTANANATGTDSFKFSFCGNGAIPDCETIQASINLNQIEKYDVTLTECSTNGVATYDLSKAAVSPQTGLTKAYYKTLAGAQNEIAADKISDFTSFSSADTSVFVRMKNTFGCFDIAKIDLKSKRSPDVKAHLYTATHCDEDIDGIIDGNYKVDLTKITPTVLANAAVFTVKYYDSLTKANAGGTDNINGVYTFSGNTSIWIRVDSPDDCPFVVKEIVLKTGNKLNLITSEATVKVCHLPNTASPINLEQYINLFFNATGTTAKFFNNLSDAQNNTGAIVANQTINTDTSYYYRVSAPNFCEEIGKLNITLGEGTPSTTLLSDYTICGDGTSTQLLNVGSGYTHILWSTGASTQSITAGVGDYWVELTNASGCVYKQLVSVKAYPVANPIMSAFNGLRCDENFDGKYEVKFSTEVSTQLLADPSLYTITYHLDSNALTTALADNWSYTGNTTVYMKIASPYCPTKIIPLTFSTGSKIQLIKKTYNTEVCDDDLDGNKKIDLSQYKTEFTTNNTIVVAYFKTLADAQQNINPIISSTDVTGTQTYYLRFSHSSECSEIGQLTIKIKTPKASADLTDIAICPDTTTQLNAGAGFQYYKWMDSNKTVIKEGANTSSINVGIGTYYVELTTNGCPYLQEVRVSTVDLPSIISIEIQGNTATVLVSGGNSPYEYSLDGVNYQTSNVFNNVPYGQNTVYVISAENCNPITQNFTVIRLLNVITPNGDGYNDFLDYSDLNQKEEVKMQIFDRNGALIFTGNKANNYTWDGKQNGRPLPSTSYWYVIQWRDLGAANITTSKGWILLKNRNNE